jgi:type IV secretory pathway TraG/TraD family ATPase VirD4
MEVAVNGTVVCNNPVPNITEPVLSIPGRSYVSHAVAVKLDEKLLSRHLMLLGGSGSGKTTTFMYITEQIRKQMCREDIAIIFDTKGEFYEKFGQSGDIVIGNSAEFRRKSHTWNIFGEILADGMDSFSIELNAREIAASLFEGRGSTSQPFFANAARDIFQAILVYFVREATAPGSKRHDWLNNKKLIRAFNSMTVEDYRNIFRAYSDFRKLLTYIGDKPGAEMSNQALGVFGELNSMISEYFIGAFADYDPQHSVSMRSAVRQKGGRAIFIEYDLSVGETLTPMYRLLVDQALKEALGRQSQETRGSVFLIADEFKLLPKLKHIDDALNFGRSLGVRVFAGIQSIDQLYDVYGKEKGAVLAAGFGSIFAYHTNDVSSREYIISRFGKNIMYYQYTNQLTDKTAVKLRDGNTVEDWHLLSLETGQAVVGLGDNPPFLFEFNDYPPNKELV